MKPTKKDISSLRSTLEYLKENGELVSTDVEVDPHLEVAAIQKHFDGGAPLLWEKVKGYPNARICNNIYATAERIARLFDVDDPRKLKFKAVEAIRQPLPPIVVKDAPCQEVVITRDVDVWDVVLPRGCDELGVAGALQGFPVELVKARTQDAWSIANAEYVIEGYVDTTQKVWESPLAEKEDQQGKYDFHPEWSGYMGKAYRTYKFQATAITHRKDRPLYYGLIVHGMDDDFIDVSMREACFLELAERIVPGLCIDTNIPMGMTDWGGIIFQVRKRRARDEGLQRNILSSALSISLGAKLGIVVDEDVDIYNMEDIMWALATRVNPKEDILTVCEGGFGQTFQPAERSSAGDRQWTQSNIRFSGGMAIDATRPFIYKDAFRRASYEVDMVDLAKFYTKDQIRKAKETQVDYAKFMADRGI